jgi:hypothetical protein
MASHTDSKSATLPEGVSFDVGTNSYWVRADFVLTRLNRFWVLTDCDTLEESRFGSEAKGIAALSTLV